MLGALDLVSCREGIQNWLMTTGPVSIAMDMGNTFTPGSYGVLEPSTVAPKLQPSPNSNPYLNPPTVIRPTLIRMQTLSLIISIILTYTTLILTNPNFGNPNRNLNNPNPNLHNHNTQNDNPPLCYSNHNLTSANHKS